MCFMFRVAVGGIDAVRAVAEHPVPPFWCRYPLGLSGHTRSWVSVVTLLCT